MHNKKLVCISKATIIKHKLLETQPPQYISDTSVIGAEGIWSKRGQKL